MIATSCLLISFRCKCFRVLLLTHPFIGLPSQVVVVVVVVVAVVVVVVVIVVVVVVVVVVVAVCLCRWSGA